MEVKAKVLELIAQVLEVPVKEIHDELAIGDIASWDSLSHMKIIATIEKNFDILFTPDILMDLEDVSDIVKATEERCK